MEFYIEFLIYMGLSPTHRQKLYWSENPHFSNTWVKNRITRNQFYLLSRYFHISRIGEEDKNDKLRKVKIYKP